MIPFLSEASDQGGSCHHMIPPFRVCLRGDQDIACRAGGMDRPSSCMSACSSLFPRLLLKPQSIRAARESRLRGPVFDLTKPHSLSQRAVRDLSDALLAPGTSVIFPLAWKRACMASPFDSSMLETPLYPSYTCHTSPMPLSRRSLQTQDLDTQPLSPPERGRDRYFASFWKRQIEVLGAANPLCPPHRPPCHPIQLFTSCTR